VNGEGALGTNREGALKVNGGVLKVGGGVLKVGGGMLISLRHHTHA
jgi:hypothetical protein